MNLATSFPPADVSSLFCNPWFYFSIAVTMYRAFFDGKATAFREVEAEIKGVSKAIRDYQLELRKSPEQKLKELKEVDWAEVKRRLRK